MIISTGRGFSLYKINDDPLFVAPHSGPALEIPTSRDEHTDVVASLCWMKTEGALLVSHMPRKMNLGIDFNRDPPPKKLSLEMWHEFLSNYNNAKLEDYRKRYAWVAYDEKDYENRLKIFNDFWNIIKTTGTTTVFVHRKFTRIKNFPSILDIITYKGRGVDKAVVKTIVEKMNAKYAPFFKSIEPQYKQAIILETQRAVNRIKAVFSDFDTKTMKVEYRTNIKADMKIINKHADRRFVKRLENNFNEKNFMLALRSALKKENPPRITLESIFAGERAMSVMNSLLNRKERIIMELECNQFLSYWYPDVAAEIITNLLLELKTVGLYKKLGVKQTHMAEFMKI